MTDESKKEMIEKMVENLPIFRMKLGLKQEELGKLIGISKYTVLGMEKHQRTMTWNTFLSLVFLFSKNTETNAMLKVFNIYTPELDEYISL